MKIKDQHNLGLGRWSPADLVPCILSKLIPPQPPSVKLELPSTTSKLGCIDRTLD